MTTPEVALGDSARGVFLSYPGGKARLARQIVAQMGPHHAYVEPFMGTASVLFAKPRSRFELLNDIDGRLVTMMRVVRDRGDELAHALAMTPYSRAEFVAADPGEVDDELEIARRVCVRIGQSFAKAGLANPSKGWRISVRVGRACSETWADMPPKVLAACERLRTVHIEQQDAVSIIERYGSDHDAIVYVDPPYVGESRTTQAIYAHEMPDEAGHRRLGAALAACKGHVLLSGYHSPLYDELFGGWERIEFDAVANHNGNSGALTRRTEVLWSNRPLALQQQSLLEETA